MSDNAETKSQNEGFIPFRQSTPIQGGWQQRRNYNQGGYQNHNQNGGGGYRGSGGGGYNNNRWNNSRGNSSFENDRSNSSCGSFRNDINAYLHPSMLQDPWEHLRRKKQS